MTLCTTLHIFSLQGQAFVAYFPLQFNVPTAEFIPAETCSLHTYGNIE